LKLKCWRFNENVEGTKDVGNPQAKPGGASIVRWKCESADAQIQTQQYCDALIFWRIAG